MKKIIPTIALLGLAVCLCGIAWRTQVPRTCVPESPTCTAAENYCDLMAEGYGVNPSDYRLYRRQIQDREFSSKADRGKDGIPVKLVIQLARCWNDPAREPIAAYLNAVPPKDPLPSFMAASDLESPTHR